MTTVNPDKKTVTVTKCGAATEVMETGMTPCEQTIPEKAEWTVLTGIIEAGAEVEAVMEESKDLSGKTGLEDPKKSKDLNGKIGMKGSIVLNVLTGKIELKGQNARTNLIVLAVVDVANSLYKNGRTILKAL